MGKNRMGWVAVLVLCGVVLFPDLGTAGMVKLSLEQLTGEADTIVQGTVISQGSAWNAQLTAIYTDVTVAVETTIKGSPVAEVTFRIKGGIVGDIGMRTSTDPVFQDGERVLVFLDTNGVVPRLVGQRQGRYTIKGSKVMKDGQMVPVDDFISAVRDAARKE